MKKTYLIISLVVLAAVITTVTVLLWVYLSRFNGDYELFKEFIYSYGLYGNLIFIAIQILQVFFALIPGEFIEFGAGYIFGEIDGFILCMIGIAAASTAIFFLMRSYGKSLFEAISDRKIFDELKFLQNEEKLNVIVFILFLIPGTPKDLITYFIGMTKIKYTHFIIITLTARIPSVFTSTIAGASAGEGNLVLSLIIYGITGVLSIIGILVYRKMIKNKKITLSNK